MLLTTSAGRAIRFSVEDVRVFAGRDSTGVRGVRLAEGDKVISMAILDAVHATPDERAAYLKRARAELRAAGAEDADEPAAPDEDEEVAVGELSDERYAAMKAAEEIILTLSSEGIGKRSSAYDFRRTGRGGQGLLAQDLSRGKDARLVAAFPVDQTDELLLVTDQGQLIRCPVRQVRTAARNTKGVIVFRTAEDEHVVSVERLPGEAGEPAEDGDETV